MKRYATNPLEDDILSDILDHWSDTISGDQTPDATGDTGATGAEPRRLEMSVTEPDTAPTTPIQPQETAQDDTDSALAAMADIFEPTPVAVAAEGQSALQSLSPAYQPAAQGTAIAAQTTLSAAPTASDETGGFKATFTASSATDNLYSDYELALIDAIGSRGGSPFPKLAELAALAGPDAPTIGLNSADFQVSAAESKLAGYRSSVWGKTYQERVYSDGIKQLDADATSFKMVDDGFSYDWFTSSNVKHTDYRVNTAVDASNAEGHVTFTGLSKNKWYSEYYKPFVFSKDRDANGLPADGHNVIYEYKNVFKGGDNGNTITGGAYADTLIGGQGDDEFHAVGGKTVMYGVDGNNTFYMGNGQSVAFGGSNSDYFDFEKNGGIAIGGGGDNVFLAGDTSGQKSIDIIGGTGSNTFVLGNVPIDSEVTVIEMNNSAGEIAENAVRNFGGIVAGKIPGIDVAWDLAWSTADFIRDVTDTSITTYTTEAPSLDVIEIWDFDPTQDKLLIPMNAKGSANITMEWNSTQKCFDVTDQSGGDSVIAKLHLAHASDIWDSYPASWLWNDVTDPDSGTIDPAEQASWISDFALGFESALLQNAVAINGAQSSAAFNVGQQDENSKVTDLDFIADDALAGLGTSQFMFLGAWQGNVTTGASDVPNGGVFTGTVHNDVLYGYDPDGTSPSYDPAEMAGDAEFWGFSGDNLYVGGAGKNVYYGGSGTDLIGFYDAHYSVEIDMSETTLDSKNREVFKFKNGFSLNVSEEDMNVGYSGFIDGFAGSQHNDTFTGNDSKNTFYSTGSDASGYNIWTGNGGNNKFHFTGGTTVITDYTKSDTLFVQKSTYGGENYLEWQEYNDAWVLYSSGYQENDACVVTALEKSDDFNGPGIVKVEKSNGSVIQKTLSEDTTTYAMDDWF